MATRTNKRSRSGAHVPCPHCGKRVRTAKGLDMHIAKVHRAEADEVRPAPGDTGHPYSLEHPVSR